MGDDDGDDNENSDDNDERLFGSGGGGDNGDDDADDDADAKDFRDDGVSVDADVDSMVVEQTGRGERSYDIYTPLFE